MRGGLPPCAASGQQQARTAGHLLPPAPAGARTSCSFSSRSSCRRWRVAGGRAGSALMQVDACRCRPVVLEPHAATTAPPDRPRPPRTGAPAGGTAAPRHRCRPRPPAARRRTGPGSGARAAPPHPACATTPARAPPPPCAAPAHRRKVRQCEKVTAASCASHCGTRQAGPDPRAWPAPCLAPPRQGQQRLQAVRLALLDEAAVAPVGLEEGQPLRRQAASRGRG